MTNSYTHTNHNTKNGNNLLIGYTTLSALNIIAGLFSWDWLGYATKPLLISVLALWYYQHSKNVRNNNFSKAFLTGLCFSVVGDTLLMLVKSKGEMFFLLGLASFLIAHIFYVLSFSLYPALKTGIIAKNPLLILPFLAMLSLTTWFLWPDLGALKFPVLIYAIVIITMWGFCYNMRNRVPRHVAQTLFIGAALFVLSDFTIAFTKFKFTGLSPTVGGLIIMSTYLIGQYLLASGMKRAGERFV